MTSTDVAYVCTSSWQLEKIIINRVARRVFPTAVGTDVPVGLLR